MQEYNPWPGGCCDSLAAEGASQVLRAVASTGISCALLFSLVPGLLAAPPPAPPPGAGRETSARPAGDSAAVHVVIDTLAMDGKGTRLFGTDEADLIPGAAGVLEKSIPLVGRWPARLKETVRFKVRVTPLPSPAAGVSCSVRVEIEAAPEPAGASGRESGSPEAASATLDLKPGEERLLEAYSSARTGGRVALKVRCGPSVAQEPDQASLVTLNVSIERAADDEAAEVLRNQILTAAMARSAITVASAHVQLPEGAGGDRRYRSERLEVTLSPILLVAGRLQMEVRVDGDVDTVSSSGETIRHPVQAAETFVAPPGEVRQVSLEIPSNGPDEGWSRVRFRVQVTCRF